MKKSATIITFLISTTLLLSFTLKNEELTTLDISGKWKVEIDNTIDGDISGNNGCSTIEFTSKGANNFVGKYASCASSKNAKNSQFSGEIYVTNRGNLISMIQDNLTSSQYYANWSGKFFENGEIRGIWTDVVGNQGEFRLSR